MVTKRFLFIALILIIVLGSNGCTIFHDELPFDEKALTYRNEFMFNNQFRMDGMYLMKRDTSVSLRYFFQDGYYYALAIDYDENDMSCYQIQSRTRNWPYVWGCFIVEDNILKVQTYDATSLNYSTKYRVKERWARIVNDSTIYFFKEIRRGETRTLDEMYHFQYCENKPDSINILMND